MKDLVPAAARTMLHRIKSFYPNRRRTAALNYFDPPIRRSLLSASAARHQQRPPETLLVIGDTDHLHLKVIFRAMPTVNVEITTTDLSADHAIKWAPKSCYRIPPAVRTLIKASRVVNEADFDSSKDNCDRLFEQAFGYPLAVDPTAHRGPLVKKPLENAAHAGVVIEGPADPEPGFAYSLLIDNLVHGHVEDIRVPVFGRSIPFCYLKYRPEKSRFSNTNTFAAVVGVSTVLSDGEIESILRFTELAGLEYGELDVLRDRTTDRIYIVDANNTPAGPPNGLPPFEARVALGLIGTAFAREFMR